MMLNFEHLPDSLLHPSMKKVPDMIEIAFADNKLVCEAKKV